MPVYLHDKTMNASHDTPITPRAKILLVDDEPRFLESLVPILNHYNYQCTTAHSGSDAIALLRVQSFDMALLDVELPDMSGCDVAAFIKSSCPTTTSVMLTGMNSVETAVVAMQQGAYDFLSKPIRHQQLLKTIEKALEHSRLERELRGSEQRFRILSEAAWEAILIHEHQQVIEANSQFLEMFGFSELDIENGVNLEQLILPGRFRQTIYKLEDQKDEGIYTSIAIKKSGMEFPVDIKSRKINFLGRPCRVWVVRDLSAQISAEKEKLDLQKKLSSANKLKALGLMAGSVAHDLNNILSGIVSYPDLLLLQMDPHDKNYNHIKKIQEAGKRAAAVVADLVAIARGGGQSKVVANINDIVAGYLDSLEHKERLSRYPGVTIQTELQPEIGNICCSDQYLYKVLLNLVGNAMEAIGQNGQVVIHTENCKFSHPLQFNWEQIPGEDYVKLVISDDGPGIDEQHMEHIFDPFYSTKVMGKSGTGLGLTIVWKIVQDHNGWIEVKNGPRGATFELYFPATHEQVCPNENWAQANLLRGNGETVLIVDDQQEQVVMLEKALGELGYRTFSVTCGEDAVAFLRSNAVDLILLDMIMGEGLNGRETFERILEISPEQKAIIVSGYAQKEEIERVRQLGISFFLEKPVTLGRVSKVMRHVLSS